MKAVRKDFLRIYREMYFLPEVEKGLYAGESELSNRAIQKWREAATYDPHTSFSETAESVEAVSKVIHYGYDFLILLSIVISSISFEFVYSHGPDEWLQVAAGIVGIPAAIVAVLLVIFRLLIALTLMQKNTVQGINRELRIGPLRIKPERKADKVFSFYVWNDGLLNTKIHTTVSFLIILRLIAPSLYDNIMSYLAFNMAKFVDYDNLRSLFVEIMGDWT